MQGLYTRGTHDATQETCAIRSCRILQTASVRQHELDHPDQPDQPHHPDHPDQPAQPAHPDHPDHPDQDHPDHPDQKRICPEISRS